MVSTVFRASLAILAFIVPALAVPAARSGMVVTPVGLRSASEVHEVPAGGSIKHVGNETHLINAAGKVIHIAQNTAPAPTSKRFETGWTAYTSWYNTESNGPINNFVTSWTVPPAPQTNNGQIVFLFNSIEPGQFNAILQPVLQWGGSAAGGGAYWSIASWYVGTGGTYYTTLYNVNVGDELTGLITLTGQSGSSYNYLSEFSNIPAAGGLALSGSAELVWATETLECYGITASTDYPAGSTVFNNIQITGTGGTPALSWSVNSDSADGVTASVNVDGATNGVVTITY